MDICIFCKNITFSSVHIESCRDISRDGLACISCDWCDWADIVSCDVALMAFLSFNYSPNSQRFSLAD